MRYPWLLAIVSVGCGGGGETALTPPPVVVASVTIDGGPPVPLLVGLTTQLTATARDARGIALSGRAISWSSTAATVASVSTSGLVTGVAAGTAQIRATAEGQTAEVAVTVRAQPWSLTGSLATGRTLHSLTVLANGSVLAVGGQVLGTPFQTVRESELYDPGTGRWRSAGRLTTGRANHVAIRLRDGKVLVAGGYSIELSARLASAELYDPATDTWSATGSMSEPRNIAEAALLADGRVLVAGGSGAGTNLNALATAEIYDPATGRWSPAMNLSVARAGHAIMTLPNGKVLVVGGGSGTFSAPILHASAEVFDPVAGVWSATGGVPLARGYHRAVALPNGRVLLTGGSDFVSTVFPASDLYDASTGAWTAAGAMVTGRISHSATVLPNGSVLVAGGGGNSVLRSAELFDPATGRWVAAGDLQVPRSNHAAALLANGKVLVAGGQGVGAATSAEIFTPQ
ncbi:MAG: Ig-like domain-containing protein [Gemmatimonadetes bacterium]|nr:Ig-like domain-containing protein [Gemmatimonadota bacterium]